jgi:hypothetical protein
MLTTEYIEPTRPYSQYELSDMRIMLFNKLGISELYVYHSKCGHTYNVKKNGKKYNEILEKGSNCIGNCSVCWKLKNIKDDEEYYRVLNMVDYHTHNTMKQYKKLSHLNNDIESCFYRWLYSYSR